MDLVSHAVIGAASALVAAKPTEIRTAAFAGAIAGMAPDADAFIHSSNDALLYLEYHRHFSHALVFIPFCALLVAALLWPLLRKSLSFSRVYLFCLLGSALAGVMDACTSYGTHLLWPFTESRLAWSVISTFDPLFTIAIAIPLLFALRRNRPALASASLLVCAVYLGIGWVQHERAATLMQRYATELQLKPERIIVKPTFGNLVLWRGIVVTQNSIQVAAVRPRLFKEDRVYPGERVDRFHLNKLDATASTRVHSDVKRFAFFTDDLLTHSDKRSIGDARYSMMPDSLRPMWSIRFDLNAPDKPVELIIDREMSKEERTRFMKMLMGKL